MKRRKLSQGALAELEREAGIEPIGAPFRPKPEGRGSDRKPAPPRERAIALIVLMAICALGTLLVATCIYPNAGTHGRPSILHYPWVWISASACLFPAFCIGVGAAAYQLCQAVYWFATGRTFK